jgi:hypothetical protein
MVDIKTVCKYSTCCHNISDALAREAGQQKGLPQGCSIRIHTACSQTLQLDSLQLQLTPHILPMHQQRLTQTASHASQTTHDLPFCLLPTALMHVLQCLVSIDSHCGGHTLHSPMVSTGCRASQHSATPAAMAFAINSTARGAGMRLLSGTSCRSMGPLGPYRDLVVPSPALGATGPGHTIVTPMPLQQQEQ